MGKKSQRKKHQIAQIPTHVIQSRITVVTDKHVCCYCGDNACLEEISYEAATQSLIDQTQQRLKQCSTFDEMWQAAITSPTGDAIYYATLKEQQKQGPCEHTRHYRCFPCTAELLSKASGIPYSGDAVLGRLLYSPLSHAVFLVRNAKDPERLGIMNTPFQSIRLVLNALRREQDIPRMKLTTISHDK